jgi:hypothetical protein
MASVDVTCSDTLKDLNNVNCNFELDENDVPGAALVKPPEHCTVLILKRWLACRGANVSGKRDDLIKRLVHLICVLSFLHFSRRYKGHL